MKRCKKNPVCILCLREIAEYEQHCPWCNHCQYCEHVEPRCTCDIDIDEDTEFNDEDPLRLADERQEEENFTHISSVKSPVFERFRAKRAAANPTAAPSPVLVPPLQPIGGGDFLHDLAMEHQRHEGWFPGSVSQRNNNPGNLRLIPLYAQKFGGVPGDKNFARFPSYEHGLEALKYDLRAKITGGSRHIDYSRNPTFLDYIKVYAPAADANNPQGYAQALVQNLRSKGYAVDLNTPLTHLSSLLS